MITLSALEASAFPMSSNLMRDLSPRPTCSGRIHLKSKDKQIKNNIFSLKRKQHAIYKITTKQHNHKHHITSQHSPKVSILHADDHVASLLAVHIGHQLVGIKEVKHALTGHQRLRVLGQTCVRNKQRELKLLVKQ